MDRPMIVTMTAVAGTFLTGVVCAVLAATGGGTTSSEAIFMAFFGAVCLMALGYAVRRNW